MSTLPNHAGSSAKLQPRISSPHIRTEPAEGFVRERITERLRKHIRIDDMLFLALQRDYGIGRLQYHSSYFPDKTAGKENLAEILQWRGKKSLFDELVNKYLLQTSI